MWLLPVVAAGYLRRIHPVIPDLAHAAQAAKGEWEPQPLDERCFYEYPACAPTCVNRVTPRNGTIYHFLKGGFDKGCFLSVDSACRLSRCFDAPQNFPQDLVRVECPITKCEFAAGLYRPQIEPHAWPAPNLTKKGMNRHGDEFAVPFHERYAAGRACRASMWALRQTPDRDALRKQCEGIEEEDTCRETPRCAWRADAPRWFHEAARRQTSEAMPYLTTDDKVAPPPPQVVKSLYDEDADAGDAPAADTSAQIAEYVGELVDTYGVERSDGVLAVLKDSFSNLLNSLGIRVEDNTHLDHFWNVIDKDSSQNLDADEIDAFVTDEGFEKTVLRKSETWKGGQSANSVEQDVLRDSAEDSGSNVVPAAVTDAASNGASEDSS